MLLLKVVYFMLYGIIEEKVVWIWMKQQYTKLTFGVIYCIHCFFFGERINDDYLKILSIVILRWSSLRFFPENHWACPTTEWKVICALKSISRGALLWPHWYRRSLYSSTTWLQTAAGFYLKDVSSFTSAQHSWRSSSWCSLPCEWKLQFISNMNNT